MDKSYESKYHRVEETNWWFVSRRKTIIDLILKHAPSIDAKILEIGCSGGVLLIELNRLGFTNSYGIDISGEAIQECKRRGIRDAKVMNAAKTRFEDGLFDIIIASDVLEHIEDDELALSEWYRIIKPGGMLLVFVPALSCLWGRHDIINHHFRRYDKQSLISKLTKPGFSISRASYWNFLLFFPAYVVRSLKRMFPDKESNPSDDIYELNPVLNNILIVLLEIENLLLKYLDLPIGVSVFAVCKKNRIFSSN
jgi:SAM-dependent methyltransferase